jgi:hypothetical protein
MSAGGGKADLEHIVRAAPRMKHSAAAAFTVRLDEVGDRRIEARLTKRCFDKTALPGAVAVKLPVLYGAAAADAEMWADRYNTFRARHQDREKVTAVGVAGNRLDLDRLARKCARHIERAARPSGYAVAQVAEPFDVKSFDHALAKEPEGVAAGARPYCGQQEQKPPSPVTSFVQASVKRVCVDGHSRHFVTENTVCALLRRYYRGNRNAAMNHSLYSADRGTHLKIVVVGLLCATLVAGVGIFARLGNLDLGTAPVVKAGQPTTLSGRLPTIR